MECESRILIDECDCILYYMPRIKIDTKICNRNDWYCYESVKLAIESSTNNTFECNCLPGCFEIGYGADISTARLGTDGFIIRQNIISESSPENAVFVFFNKINCGKLKSFLF